jgi:NAD-dependent dihydropyrimidine dehydrogenase PreA subunit
MVHIDNTRCTGCGYCVDACPQGAITIENNAASIHQDLCTQCNSCAAVCPVGAIRELAPAYSKPVKGGETMTYGYGRGFGFRGASPAWPYIGRGRGGLPRCWHPGLWGGVAYPTPAFNWPTATREEELGFLKDQADAMKRQLEDIESRIRELEKKD